jgi:hypothetical protein
LVEARDGWHLRVRLTPALRELLLSTDGTATAVDVTVHVQPNLLPGEPFAASLIAEGPDGSAEW